MKRHLGLIFLATVFTFGCANAGLIEGTGRTPSASELGARTSPPPVDPSLKCQDCVQEYWGERVAQPYSIFLTEPNSAQVQKFLADQNAYTNETLKRSPRYDEIVGAFDRFKSRTKTPHPGTLLGEFRYYNTGFKIFRKAVDPSLVTAPELVVDLQPFVKVGLESGAALAGFDVSPDGTKIAFAIHNFGQDRRYLQIYDLATKTKLPEVLEDLIYLTPIWAPDSKGLFYPYRPQDGRTLRSSIRFHRLGDQRQDLDRLIYRDRWLKNTYIELRYAASLQALVIQAFATHFEPANIVLLPLTRNPQHRTYEIFPKRDRHNTFIGAEGSRIFLKTADSGSPNGKIISVEVDPVRWTTKRIKDVVPQSNLSLIEARMVAGRIFTFSVDHQTLRLSVYDLNGKMIHRDLSLPGFEGLRGTFNNVVPYSPEGGAVVTFSTFLNDEVHAVYDTRSDQWTESLGQPPTELMAKYTLSYSTIKSRDGQDIDLTFLQLKDAPVGPKPTYLYFYGNAAAASTPRYMPVYLAFAELFGGQMVMAAPRGGAEKGLTWLNAGRARNKEATFNDMIDVAETLIQAKQTTSDQLFLAGRSSGGFNTLAIANRRPDLFAGIIPNVPLADMLSYQRPINKDGGERWVWEYGEAADRTDFEVLRRVSPLHNLPKQKYPAILLVSARNDDRINGGAHSYPFFASLVEAKVSRDPFLVVTPGSHLSARNIVEELLFVSRVLDE